MVELGIGHRALGISTYVVGRLAHDQRLDERAPRWIEHGRIEVAGIEGVRPPVGVVGPAEHRPGDRADCRGDRVTGEKLLVVERFEPVLGACLVPRAGQRHCVTLDQ